MIREVSGKLVRLTGEGVILDLGGLGLELLMAAPALGQLPAPGQEVRLLTHLHVREDALTLFGFSNEAEYAMFRALLKVPSIGPRLAMRVLNIPVVELQRALAAGDHSLLPTIKGVGPKIKKALVLALRDTDVALGLPQTTPAGAAANQSALRALQSLGYREADARAALRAVGDEVTNISARVKAALQFLS